MDTELLKPGQASAGMRPGKNKTKSFFFLRTKPYNGLTPQERQIVEAAIAARDEWAAANDDFNYADDDLLVDYHIYRLKACEARYTYFLKLAKEKGLTL
jgi:hypothetical protein